MFPWWYFVPIAALLLAAFGVSRNSRKFRREFGKETTESEIRAKYPKARIFAIRRKYKN